MNKFRKVITTVFEKTGIDNCIDERKVNLYLEKFRNPTRKIFKGNKAHTFIANTIRKAKPAAFGKIGDIECTALSWHLEIGRFYKYTWTSPTYGQLGLYEQAGVFPKSKEIYHRFCDLLLDRLKDIDACALWFNPGESELTKKNCPHSTFIELTSLEPYFNTENPWSLELAGKKILVIHPFADSIHNQFSEAIRGFAPGPNGLEGGIVNSSRAILFPGDGNSGDAAAWERAVDAALGAAVDELGEAIQG